jgi:hypothetical protein
MLRVQENFFGETNYFTQLPTSSLINAAGQLLFRPGLATVVAAVLGQDILDIVLAEDPQELPCLPLQHCEPEARIHISNHSRWLPTVGVLGVRDPPIIVTPEDVDLGIVIGDGTDRSSKWRLSRLELA